MTCLLSSKPAFFPAPTCEALRRVRPAWTILYQKSSKNGRAFFVISLKKFFAKNPFLLQNRRIKKISKILLTSDGLSARICLALSETNKTARPNRWGYSSAGRALEWHSRGQRFDPAYLHQMHRLVQENRCNRKITAVFLLICSNFDVFQVC